MKQKIEELREYINRAMSSEDRDMDEILKKSEELDQIIILYYKEKDTIKDKNN